MATLTIATRRTITHESRTVTLRIHQAEHIDPVDLVIHGVPGDVTDNDVRDELATKAAAHGLSFTAITVIANDQAGRKLRR